MAEVTRQLIWAFVAIPLVFILFIFLSVVIFVPVGGGVLHLLHAYSPSGNVEGARCVFVSYLISATAISVLMVFLRYPAPWLWIATISSLICVRSWLLVCTFGEAGAEFRHQALF